MTEQAARVLVVEDCHDDPCILAHLADSAGSLAAAFEFVHARTMGEALLRLSERPFDAVLLDLAVEGGSGLAAFSLLHAAAPEVPLVVVATPDNEVAALKAVQHGAQDYLLRGEIYGTMLMRSLHHAIERKRTAAELAAAEEQARLLVESSPYGICALDAEGRITALNPAAERVLARSIGELRERHFSSFIAPESRELALGRFREAVQGADLPETELYVIRPDGERRLVGVSLTCLLGDGEVIGVHAVARDITRERARDEQVRVLATALETLDEGVSIYDGEGRVRYTNAALGRILGYFPDDPRPGGGETRAEVLERLRILRAARAGGGWRGRVERRRSDGRVIPLDINVRPIRFDHDELFFVIARDVSQEVANEQQLRRAERLASLGTLVGGVAHELNNPLTSIRSFAELLLQEGATETQREALEIIKREADRTARIVADLRQLTWNAQQERDELREAVDLNAAVRDVLRLRRYSLETHDIRVQEELAAELPPLWAERGKLQQVVLQLVLNAEQTLLESSGERRITLRTRASRTRIWLEVSDTGAGIESRHLDRIFDPFWTTKAPGEGVGIGLSLVHTLVTEHGGTVTVESEPGAGATFIVAFPRAARAEAAPPDAAAPAPAPARPTPLRVLVVDDEPAIRYSLAAFLRRRGHRVTAAEGGQEALRLIDASAAEADAFDAILTDLRMPGMNGDELLEQLRARPGGEAYRFVIMTGDARSRAVVPPDVPVVLKPFDLDAIAALLEQRTGKR